MGYLYDEEETLREINLNYIPPSAVASLEPVKEVDICPFNDFKPCNHKCMAFLRNNKGAFLCARAYHIQIQMNINDFIQGED